MPTRRRSFSVTEVDLEQCLGLGQVHALEIGDGIDDLQRVIDGGDGGDQLAREGGDHLGDVGELVAGVARQRFDLQPFFDVSGASEMRAFR